MRWVSRLSMRAAIPFATCCLLAALVGVARAGDKAQLSGTWNFNLDQSDDPQRKVQEAQQKKASAEAPAGATREVGAIRAAVESAGATREAVATQEAAAWGAGEWAAAEWAVAAAWGIPAEE
jgi:hypothetical protein